ncbi:MAG TPA: glutamate formimidoyltransferase [Chthonomonadaceae bacterium]|nr:glutamate formimidoyltransferase [Chthonomonadaceae bacterium]
MTSVFQCVPNFSEGRRLEVVAEIAAALRSTPEVRLIDHSADGDHNRCVMTLLGDAGPIRQAALAAARVAVARIDLRTHHGVHPRAGAVDVLPVVPIRNAGREEAVALAHAIGTDLATELALPIYFYEWAALPGRHEALPKLRGRGFEAFAALPLVGDLAPDLGPDHVHPTAGIVVVGARGPLVAYNIDLDTSDVEVARALARRIRAERDVRRELTGVRALGLYLASRDLAQVSMNLTRPELTPLSKIFDFVRAEAHKMGEGVLESEIIGVIPRAALGMLPPEAIAWNDYKPEQILENWL